MRLDLEKVSYQRSEVGEEKWGGIVEHAAEHTAYLVIGVDELGMLILRDIATIECKV